MSKVSVLISIARQVDGEYVFCKALKASKDPDSLYKFLRQNPLPPTDKINNVDVVLEYGVLEEIEIDD